MLPQQYEDPPAGASPWNDPFFHDSICYVHDRPLHSPILASDPCAHTTCPTSVTTHPLATQAPSHPMIPRMTPQITPRSSLVCPMHAPQTLKSQAPCSPNTGPH